MDYLSKWLEVFPTLDQTSLTIATPLVELVVSQMGSRLDCYDIGTTFLPKLMHEVYPLLDMYKVYTKARHPQTDGVVERFKVGQREGDVQLPYVLY